MLLVKGVKSNRRVLSNCEVGRSIDYKHVRSLFSLRSNLLESPLPSETKRKKVPSKRSGWHLSRKAKILISVVIIAIILVSTFVFLSQGGGSDSAVQQSTPTPTPPQSPTSQTTNNPQSSKQISHSSPSNVQNQPSPTHSSRPGTSGLIESATSINSTIWRAVASNAWNYFQPNLGVNQNTGLPYAATGFHDFTDWDLGGYIQAVIDAQEIGLINATGDWGSYSRLDKVLTFLETRQLNNYSYPYQFYASNGQPDISDSSNETVDVADTGRLLLALNNLITFSQQNTFDWTQRIDNLVYNQNQNRSNFAALVPAIKTDITYSINIYSYYVDSGFGSFFPAVADATTEVLNNILSRPQEAVSGVMLPNGSITCDPLFSSIFELSNNDPRLLNLASQVYLAQENNYNATGQFVAYSEGYGNSNRYIYEWVVGPNGQPWAITDDTQTHYFNNISPFVYTKTAFSFLALYNTTYAKSVTVFLEKILPEPSGGYYDGADNNGNLVDSLGSNTNGLVLDAALYAIKRAP